MSATRDIQFGVHVESIGDGLYRPPFPRTPAPWIRWTVWDSDFRRILSWVNPFAAWWEATTEFPEECEQEARIRHRNAVERQIRVRFPDKRDGDWWDTEALADNTAYDLRPAEAPPWVPRRTLPESLDLLVGFAFPGIRPARRVRQCGDFAPADPYTDPTLRRGWTALDEEEILGWIVPDLPTKPVNTTYLSALFI